MKTTFGLLLLIALSFSLSGQQIETTSNSANDSPAATTLDFYYTGSSQSWTIPAGVNSITIEAYGAQGGSPTTGALGGHIKATHTVVPGSTLYIYVGGQGTLNSGGYNGGGGVYSGTTGAFGGGGATDIRIGGTALGNRVIVAGAGGGTGASGCCSGPAGGIGGGSTGGNGTDCWPTTCGYGGSQSSGGSGSNTSSFCGGSGNNGSAGYSGSGGTGGTTSCCIPTSINGGAGGGGGYFGGGGSSFGGAGGGSSYSSGTILVNEQGVRSGNGLITITYISGPTITTSGTLSAFSAISGTVSATQNFTASGSVLSADISVTAPTGFELCLTSGGTYSSSLTLAQTGGTVASTTIYVRMASSATGTPSGNITLTSAGATTINMAVNGTVYTTPTTQATNVTFTSTTDVSTSISWTNGNGSSRAVFMKAANTGTAAPVNGTTYTANTSFGSGTQIGSTGWYCVYNGTGTSVAVTNLVMANFYTTMVIEYNGVAGTQAYFTSTATNNPKTFSTTNAVTLNYAGSIVNWTVPTGVTTVTVDAYGAQGGNDLCSSGYNYGGLGVRMAGTFTVVPGNTIQLLVGQQGGNSGNTCNRGGGGGGGTFVYNYSTATLMIASGGGGGAGQTGYGSQINANANATTDGNAGANTGGASGGTVGAGGGAASMAGGGAGWNSNGATGSYSTGGIRFLAGGAGGALYSDGANGGFGGGGGCYAGAGGGGGYSGGGGGGWSMSGWGGGGGSYNAGTNQTNTAGSRSGNGIVTITCQIASTILVGGTLNTFATTTGAASTAQSFTVSGLFLTDNISVTAPTGFEISLSNGSGYSGSITLTQTSGSVSVTTIYVRLSSSATGTQSGNISLTSTGATTQTIAVSGTVYATSSVQATNITATNITNTTATLSWTNGYYSSRAVFIKVGTSGSASPLTGTVYIANTNFGSGSQIGSTGWYCVYNGTGTSVSVTGLSGSTFYMVMVTEYNGGANYPTYLTTTATNNPKQIISSTLYTNNYSGSIINWIVPSGVYTISVEAYGAQGGNDLCSSGYNYGGLGAKMTGTFTVTPGNTIQVLAGGQGGNSANTCNRGGGGGGGTYVYNLSTSTLMIAAGAGGGAGQAGYASGTNANANISNYGNAGSNSGGAAGGTGGAGGGAASMAGGGAGWNSNGATGSYSTGGTRFLEGGAGGVLYSDGANGGFGGGGGSYAGAGGGGGYSGGGGGGWSMSGWGGGGGSYNAGSTQTNIAANRSGNGLVTINCQITPSIITGGLLTAFTASSGLVSTYQSFTTSGVLLTDNVIITPPTGFEVSLTSGSGYAGSLTLIPTSGTISETTIYIRMSTAATGTPSGNVALTSTGATTQNVAASGIVYITPTTQATNISFSGTTIAQTIISWTNGNGSNRAVFMKVASSGTASPANAATYTANTLFGSGSQIGSTGWYCVYNGTATSVTVTNLLPVTPYIVMVCEFNGIITSETYKISVSTNNPNTFTSSNSTTFNYSGSITNFIIPAGVNVVTVDTYGAQGGSDLCSSGYNYGGLGAKMTGTFVVTPGNTLQLLVGGQGGNSGNPCNRGGGGGGGTYVYNYSTSTLMIAAGAGGGAGQAGYAVGSNANANVTSDGNAGTAGGGAAGGTSGNGGYATSMTGGGTGWNSNGASSGYGTGGTRFLAGGAGGILFSDGANGGFGGGGGSYAGAGGGGGYSGGGGGGWSMSGWGGGGGSYNAGASQANTAGSRSGNGLVTITFYPVTPTILTTGTLSAFTANAGSASTAQNFTASGTVLSEDITVTAPTGFEVSLSSGSGYADFITLTQSGGTVASTTVYVRLTSSATGTPSGDITLTSTGATTVNVAVSGTVNALPTISVQPSASAQNLNLNGPATALTITASAGSGTISTYQWYKNASNSNTGGTAVGTNSAAYTPLTTSLGVLYYYCVVTNSNSGSVTSNVSGAITVNALPTISVQPSTTAQTVCENVAATALSITASAGSGTISTYQWYKNASNANTGGTSVGTNSASYTPSTSTAGVLYYYCIVTNSNGGTVSSNVSGSVTVNANLSPPSPVTATPASIQSGQSSNLNATSAGNTISWFAAASGGTALGSSASAVNYTVTPAATTTYYAESVPAAGSTGSQTINYSGSIVNFTVPAGVTSLIVETKGAQGGISGSNAGGLGAYIKGTVTVTPGQVLKVLAGGQGSSGLQGGGGGGSFVTTSSNGALVVAGGGGGAQYTGTYNLSNANGTTGTSGQAGMNSGYLLTGGAGGSSGNGGSCYTGYAGTSQGAGGGGITGNGSTCNITGGGKSFVNGGAGGTGAGSGGAGGFGGGGGADWSYWTGGGGGGGYSGGGGGTYYGVGGGGGSYNGGTSPTNISGSQSGNGQVIFTWTVPNSSGCPSLTRTPVTVTVANPPTVTTAEITASTATTASGGGEVTDIGGSAVTARGVCWSTIQNPTIALSTKTNDGTGIGSFTSAITNLTGGTLYYVRAYATNTQGTSYGNQVSFSSFAPGSIAGTQTICSGSNPALFTSVAAAVGITGFTYQWQSCTDNVSFADISGATSSTFQAGALSVTTYFRRNAVSGATTLSSNTITVTIDAGSASPTSVTATPATILAGGSSNLNATVAVNNEVKWYTASTGGTLLSTVSSGTNYAVSPSVTTTYYAASSPVSCSDNTLANVLTNLNSNYANITSQIPSPYNFALDGTGGVNANYISDGGSDMYDGGNYVSTNNTSSFSYNDNSVLTSSIFGTGGKYFTRKVNNLFVLAADMVNVSSYKVNGNYGSDGGGTTSSSTFSITVGCKTFNCFLSRVYNASDPSINELFIIPANASASHTGIANTNDSYHQLNGITASTRMYYLLYAGSSGSFISDASAQNIATAFISQTQAVINGSGGCPGAIRVPVTVTVSGIPVVTTDAITDIAATTATGGGNVTADGGSAVTVRGVCWSTLQSPTTANTKTTDGTNTGTFTSSLTGLTTGSTYYVRAYATNAMGTAYGNEVNFASFALGTFANINKTFGDPAFTLVNPTSASPGAFSYTSSNTGVATISGNTVTIIGAGTSTITATQAASGGYGSAQTTCTLTVALANQNLTLTIPTSQPLNYFTGGNTLTLTAVSSSGLDVTVAINTGASTATATLTATATAGVYTLSNVSNAGTIVFVASQAGNANYNAASLSQSYIVTMGNQLITFNALPVKTYGDADFVVSASGGASGNPVTFTSSNTAIATCNGTNGATVSITGAGSCLITANQAGNGSWNAATAVSQLLTVDKATPVITFNAISKVYSDPPFTVSATSASTGAFTYSSGTTSVATLSGSTATITGVGASTLTASQAADNNYLAAAKDATLTVGKASQTISITEINDISLLDFNGNPIQVTATATSGLPVTLTLAGGSVATLNGSNQLESTGFTGTVTVYANQAGDGNYNAASQASEIFAVTISGQSITFDALPDKYLADPPFDLMASSTSNLLVTYVSSNTDVATIAGKEVTIVGLGTTTITASQAGNAYYSAATSVDQDLTVTKEGQVITFDPLPNKQIGDPAFALTATTTSNLTIAYASSNTSVATVTLGTVTIVGIGTTNITASQPGNMYYDEATPVVQSLTVGAEVFVDWIGVTSTNWYTAANWSSDAVPSGTTNVIILSTAPHQPTVTNEMTPASCQKLTINTGAVLTLDAGSALTVNGLFTSNAGNTGLVILSGGSLIESTVGVAGSMACTFPANEWHLVSSPVTAAVSGLFTGKYLMTHTESSNLYTDITSTTATLVPVKGYALWGGDAGFSEAYSGILNTGSQSSVVTRAGEGWNLVGNPYPSSIDWDAASGWTKNNVNDATYVHVDPETWATYVGGVGAPQNVGSRYIAPGQGFFVEATGSGTLVMNNSIRVHHATTFFKSSESDPVDNLVRLKITGNGYSDEAVIRLLPIAGTEFDGSWDAHKLFGDVPEAPQIYSLGSSELAINTLPEAQPVPVGMRVNTSGNYSITATEVNGLRDLILEDTKNNTFNKLALGAYQFSFDAGENEHRFILHFSTLGIDETEASVANIYSYHKTAYINLKNQLKGDIYIYNMAGQLITSRETAIGLVSVGINATGIYIVKVVSDKKTTTAKIFIQ